jgi:hypothetical protein
LLRLWAWLTACPYNGFFPQISHALDIYSSFLTSKNPATDRVKNPPNFPREDLDHYTCIFLKRKEIFNETSPHLKIISSEKGISAEMVGSCGKDLFPCFLLSTFVEGDKVKIGPHC